VWASTPGDLLEVAFELVCRAEVPAGVKRGPEPSRHDQCLFALREKQTVKNRPVGGERVAVA